MTARPHDDRGVPLGRLMFDECECSPSHAAAAHASGCPLVDCRLPEEFELVHIAGSISIPVHDLIARLDELEHLREQQFFVLCHTGCRSLRAVSILRHFGFDRARSVCGGIDAWASCIQTHLTRYRRGSDGQLLPLDTPPTGPDAATHTNPPGSASCQGHSKQHRAHPD